MAAPSKFESVWPSCINSKSTKNTGKSWTIRKIKVLSMGIPMKPAGASPKICTTEMRSRVNGKTRKFTCVIPPKALERAISYSFLWWLSIMMKISAMPAKKARTREARTGERCTL